MTEDWFAFREPVPRALGELVRLFGFQISERGGWKLVCSNGYDKKIFFFPIEIAGDMFDILKKDENTFFIAIPAVLSDNYSKDYHKMVCRLNKQLRREHFFATLIKLSQVVSILKSGTDTDLKRIVKEIGLPTLRIKKFTHGMTITHNSPIQSPKESPKALSMTFYEKLSLIIAMVSIFVSISLKFLFV